MGYNEIDDLSPSAPQAVQCRFCGARYLLIGSGDVVCEVCNTPLTGDNVDPVFYSDEIEDDY